MKHSFRTAELIEFLEKSYELQIENVSLLLLGADFDTSVYLITTTQQQRYFLKLRSGEFLEASVTVPMYLTQLGMKRIIFPIRTISENLFTSFLSFTVVLYPYVKGKNSVEKKLSANQWIQLGQTMKTLHTSDIPGALTQRVPRETFSSKWIRIVKKILDDIKHKTFDDGIAQKTSQFLNSQYDNVVSMTQRAEKLAPILQKKQMPYVLCHADLHGWNIMVENDESFYIVDWDTMIFAPKERDLMFIGAGISDSGCTFIEEEQLFYQGYSQTEINYDAIAYYRYARIIEDIGEYCEHIFYIHDESSKRAQSFARIQANFHPGGTIERAHSSWVQEYGASIG